MLNRNGTLVAYAYELMDRGPELDRDALVEMICRRVLALIGADATGAWVCDEEGRPHFERVVGERPSACGIAVERELVDLMASEGVPVLNSGEAPLRPGLAQLCEKLEAEASSAVCLELRLGSELFGVLCLHQVGSGDFAASEISDAQRFAKFAALALHHMDERERAERDEVTGLPGRTLILRAIDEGLRAGKPFTLACVDFDGLKAVNETLGYEAGNELICAVADAVKALLERGELVGRLHGRGGD